MAGNYDALVLMGPPGSGKSHLGRLLQQRGIAYFEELEARLVEIFGSGPSFAARKTEALDWIEQQYQRQLRESSLPVVIQSTGLSDRGILLRLLELHRVAVLRVNTPRELCVLRVQQREQQQNLNNDPLRVAEFHDYWNEQIAPGWNFDLEISGEDAGAAIAAVEKLLRA